MIKGIVVEHKKKHTIMLTNNGVFYRTKKLNKLVGEETFFEPLTSNPLSFHNLFHWLKQQFQWKAIVAIALCVMLAFPIYSSFGKDEVYAYVSIDINPSIELSLNDHYEVIGIEGLNDDGKNLLTHLTGWKKQSLQDVSKNILSLSQNMGYLQDNHSLLFGISFVGQIKQSDHLIIYDVADNLKTEFDSINIASFEVPNEYREEAKLENTSMNIVYASQILEDEKNGEHEENNQNRIITSSDEDDEEQEEQEKDHQERGDYKDKHVDQKQTTTSNEKSNNRKVKKNNIKVIEKFLLEAEEGKIPPGIQKKIEQLGITKEDIDEYFSDDDETDFDDEDSDDELDEDEDSDDDEEEDDDDENYRKDDQKNRDFDQKDRNKNKNKKGKHRHWKGDNFTPPGLKNKNKDHDDDDDDEEDDDDDD
ncbi:anti-sigma-I factor RsgI family protein [Bacillaceae bacterium W0354]